MSIVSLIVLVISALGKMIDRLDESSKAEARKALLDAARVRLEDGIIAEGSRAYSAALSGKLRDNDPYLRD